MAKKKDVSAIVRGAGLLTSISTELVAAVRERGGTDEDIHRLVTPEGRPVIAKMADLIVSQAREVFTVAVDYSRSLTKMIKAGRYDWVNSDISPDHFLVKGKGKLKLSIVLFHFNRDMESGDALTEMDKQGCRPFVIEELLALGETEPELQRKFPIVALGSVWTDPRGDRRVPYLDRDGSGRGLDLGWLDDVGWGAGGRFAGLRK